MKKKLLKIISTISLVLVMALSPLFVQSINSKSTSENLAMQTRTVNAESQMIDYESVFNEFEDGKLNIDGTLTTFEGSKTFSLSDFEELDLLSNSDVEVENDEFKVKYHYGYDYETNIVTLTAILIVEEDVPLIDTLEGYAFINEQGNIDAAFDFDGETMFLSELQELGMIENCGWFKNLCKKVSNAVKKTVNNVVNTVTTAVNKTVESVKTATSSTAGAIITGLGAAACVAVGVIGAVVAAPAIAVVAVGAVVGATALSTATITSTSQNNGEVDWDAVKQSAVVGAVLGGAISGVSYAATNAIKSAVAKSSAGQAASVVSTPKAEIGNKLDYAFGKATGDAHNVTRSMENASQLSKIGIYDNSTGYEILTEHFNKTLADNASLILAENAGRTEVMTLLSGPGGFLNVKSIWEGVKLITFIFIG